MLQAVHAATYVIVKTVFAAVYVIVKTVLAATYVIAKTVLALFKVAIFIVYNYDIICAKCSF